MVLRAASMFAGVGGLDLALRIAVPRSRTVLHIERDSYAASALVARMEDSALDPAPIWDDVTAFDGRAWRGAVDIILAGFPCQDISAAGRGEGIDGERSGLFFELMRIVREVRPQCVYLENVSAITVRGVDRVLGSLAEVGLDAEWLCLKASDVGAPHRRERWFCLAYRMEHTGHVQPEEPESVDVERGQRSTIGRREQQPARPRTDGGDSFRGDASGDGGDQPSAEDGAATRGDVADGIRPRLEEWRRLTGDDGEERSTVERGGGTLADTPNDHRRTGEHREKAGTREDQERGRGSASGRRSVVEEHVPDTIGHGLRIESERRQSETRETERRHDEPFDLGAFPPGPGDREAWERILEVAPHLAPAIEPGFRVLADGLAYVVDLSRTDQLRCCGNGVVPLQAAVAFVELARRAGISDELGIETRRDL